MEYGVFALVTSVTAVAPVAATGANNAMVRFLAKEGRSSQGNVDLVSGFLAVVGLTLCIALVLALLRQEVVEILLRIPAPLATPAADLLMLLLLASIFVAGGQVMLAVLDSQQMVYLSNMLQFALTASQWTGIVVLLILHADLLAVGYAMCVASVCWSLVVSVIALRTWGPLKLKIGKAQLLASLKKQIHYSSQILLANSIGYLYEPLTKVLISNFLGLSSVGIFDIGLRVRNVVWGLVSRSLYPLFPGLASLREEKGARTLVTSAERIMVPASILLAVALVTIARPLAHVWVGVDVERLSATIAVLGASHLLFSSTITPYYYFLYARGRIWKTVLMQGVNASGNMLLFFLLLGPLQYNAALISNSGALLLSGALGLAFRKGDLSCGFPIRLAEWFRIGLLATFLLCAGMVSVAAFQPFLALVCIAASTVVALGAGYFLLGRPRLLFTSEIETL